MMLNLAHPMQVDNEIHMSDIVSMLDNIKGKANKDNIDTDIYNCLEYVEAMLQDRVPMYKDLY